jgi:uncharacterized protein (TIGR04255 family)
MSESTRLDIQTDEESVHLSRAPIVEAVIEVRARAEVIWDEAAISSALMSQIPDYRTRDSLREFQHELRVEPGHEPQQTVRDLGWRGLVLESAGQPHVVQYNRDGFVFSRLRPYETWEQFSCEGLRLWQIYQDLAQPSEIQRLGLRFINRIEMTLLESGYDDYLTAHPKSPVELDLPVQGFFHHDVLVVPGYDYAINVIRTIQPPQQPESGAGLILDVDVFTTQPLALESDALHNRLIEMRWLKNKVFFGSLTPNALEALK